MNNEEIIYRCDVCGFTDENENVVVLHWNQHEASQQNENASFWRNAYAVTVCDNVQTHVSTAKSADTSFDNTEDQNFEIGNADSQNEHNASWSERPTKMLIAEYREKKPLVEGGKIKTLKKMWEKIGAEMTKNGYNFSVQQIENKWKSLERSFKNAMEHKKKTGRGRKSCAYEKELSEILEKRHSINPVCILQSSDNDKTSVNTNNNRDCFQSTTVGPSEITTPSSSRSATPGCSRSTSPNRSRSATPERTSKNVRNLSVMHELQQLRKTIAARTAKLEEIENKKFEQRQQIIEQLKLKNVLLQQVLPKDI